MRHDFEATLQDFLTKAKEHFENQQTTISEYERLFSRAQEILPAYSAFVHYVNEALTALNNPSANQTPVPQPSLGTKSGASHFRYFENKKILIVDDAEINRILMSHLFKNSGVVLEFANSGEVALLKVSKQRFDIILMDIQMKGMSGLEAIQSIRQVQPEQQSKTTILALTNTELTEDERKQAIAAGANDYLSKGMTREALREKIFEMLAGKSEAQTA